VEEANKKEDKYITQHHYPTLHA